MVAMLIVGWHSDKSNELRWHAAISALVAGLFLVLEPAGCRRPATAIAMFSIASMAIHELLSVLLRPPHAPAGRAHGRGRIGIRQPDRQLRRIRRAVRGGVPDGPRPIC